MKRLYQLAIALGIGIAGYFYLFNFDNMSETELVNSVLYWYIPLAFGLYGITALRIKKNADEHTNSSIKLLFSNKDKGLLMLSIIVLLVSSVFGMVVFFVPLLMFKPNSERFDLNVALVGTILWLVLLFLFFKVLWPAL